MIAVKTFNQQDYPDVKRIYQQGIDTGNASFQSVAKDWLEWDSSMLKCCRLVAVQDKLIIGWAALSPISSRDVYSGVAEVSIYLAKSAQGKGIGHLLLSRLITDSESNHIWTLQAGIFPENEASIELHKKNGFRIIGVREKLGQMGTLWRDVVLMERRSKLVGI
jgi:L-amino acid N-acyltransferase YncA